MHSKQTLIGFHLDFKSRGKYYMSLVEHELFLDEVRGSNAKVLLELACEVLWIVESETFGSL